MLFSRAILCLFVFVVSQRVACAEPVAGKLYVGAATISITPDERVALDGSMQPKVSETVETPCVATALVLETRSGDKSVDVALFVACDLVMLRGGEAFYRELREQLKGQVPEELLSKMVVNATHTHTAPLAQEGAYTLPESGLMRPKAYREFLMERLAQIVVEAWNSRAPAKVAWGLGHAVLAQNRRALYADGSAVMYGKTNDPNFRGLEGHEDHGVELLYFWNDNNDLIATAINVACPAQEAERRSRVNADFWHQVREQLQKKHGAQLHVVPWCGAAGDQSPHLMYRSAAEERMQTLRGGDRLDELARRIVSTWEDVLQVVKGEQHDNLLLEHRVEKLTLPARHITPLEAQAAQNAADSITDPKNRRRDWLLSVVRRYKKQEAGETPDYVMEFHTIRLGDVAIVNAGMELFTDYGVQIKARSPALQTFVIQLTEGGSYLPTPRAIAGGGYSAVPQSNLVGPEAGQVLVEKAVALIDELWKTAPESAK
ncbi:hypothetical protein [Planctomicrobium sp. SH664]|uniref:hypothetical protein n=1 Tax=Planctomicrobium sp. SH664 TaxID=3448125 RepID=UPI003F5B9ADC